MIKNEHIAVSYNGYGECVSVAKVKVVDRHQFADLLNEQSKTEEKYKLEKQKLIDKIKSQDTTISYLKLVIMHLLGQIELSEEKIATYLGKGEEENETKD